MPACIAHALLVQRVETLCQKRQIPLYDHDLALIGAQGPDVFFFHRAFPWQLGKRGFQAGLDMHHGSPQRLLQAFTDSARHAQNSAYAKGYLQGFLCHYALDRTAHPFVLYWQQQLRRQQPGYGQTDSQYHFRIESALDTLILQRQTGRRIADFRLTALVPPDRGGRYLAIGQLYQPIYRDLLHRPEVTAEQIAQAPGDMREAMFWMTDRHGARSFALRGVEALLGKGPLGTSLLRPLQANDWDYANAAHRQWHNPAEPAQTSTADFYELFEQAAQEATAMIAALLDALDTDTPLPDITGDRGFASNRRGVYENKEW